MVNDTYKTQSKLVFVKYIILVLSILVMLLLVIAYWLFSRDKTSLITNDNTEQNSDNYRGGLTFSVNYPVLEGYLKDHCYYNISAETIVPHTNKRYMLSKVRAKYIFNNSSLSLNSDYAIFDYINHIIEFNKNIAMTFGKMTLKTDKLVINSNDKQMATESISFTYNGTKITAENSIVYYTEKVIKCSGNIVCNIRS
ncbi:hypothetical protein [Rickettsia endosymbiont of Cardiosporidium cionae]|uniref:hypothetical protein n=1 Tax=Rickettsia endosymbiont of Cardiosporidium cionae TaxID=2777155 RepID=UPI0018944DEC|nr:hypothetical protein [Rickettsia endosymbiont of Cardiosporidium cionae]KAF8818543.1 hypothetical protein IHI24_000259 [Rickettsia endosymbiont of Cardiosporidium cionae]